MYARTERKTEDSQNAELFILVVTKTQNEMERNGLFHSILLRILCPEAIQSLSLNPKNFNLGIPDPKLKLFC